LPGVEGGILQRSTGPEALSGVAKRSSCPPGRMPGSTAGRMPAATARECSLISMVRSGSLRVQYDFD
jgi:hypothetical protein